LRTPHHRPLQVVAGPPWRVAWDPHGPFRTPCRPHPHVATSVPRAPTSTPTQHRVRSSPTPPRTPHHHPPHTRDEGPRGRRQPAWTTASTHGTSWRAVQRRVATALPAPITNTGPTPSRGPRRDVATTLRSSRANDRLKPPETHTGTSSSTLRRPSPPAVTKLREGPTSAIVATL